MAGASFDGHPDVGSVEDQRVLAEGARVERVERECREGPRARALDMAEELITVIGVNWGARVGFVAGPDSISPGLSLHEDVINEAASSLRALLHQRCPALGDAAAECVTTTAPPGGVWRVELCGVPLVGGESWAEARARRDRVVNALAARIEIAALSDEACAYARAARATCQGLPGFDEEAWKQLARSASDLPAGEARAAADRLREEQGGKDGWTSCPRCGAPMDGGACARRSLGCQGVASEVTLTLRGYLSEELDHRGLVLVEATRFVQCGKNAALVRWRWIGAFLTGDLRSVAVETSVRGPATERDLARLALEAIVSEEARRVADAAKPETSSFEIASEKEKQGACTVSGCPNRIGEGSFVGSLCRPCYDMLESGNVGWGMTFIHRLDARAREASHVEPNVEVVAKPIGPAQVSPFETEVRAQTERLRRFTVARAETAAVARRSPVALASASLADHLALLAESDLRDVAENEGRGASRVFSSLLLLRLARGERAGLPGAPPEAGEVVSVENYVTATVRDVERHGELFKVLLEQDGLRAWRPWYPSWRSETPRLVADEVDAIARMLVQKNTAYGDSALSPIRVFSRASSEEGLLVRIDDKLSRISRGSAAGEDATLDLLGYLVLLHVARARAARAPTSGESEIRAIEQDADLTKRLWDDLDAAERAMGESAAEARGLELKEARFQATFQGDRATAIEGAARRLRDAVVEACGGLPEDADIDDAARVLRERRAALAEALGAPASHALCDLEGVSRYHRTRPRYMALRIADWLRDPGAGPSEVERSVLAREIEQRFASPDAEPPCPRVVVAALVASADDRVLLVQGARHPGWALPAGKMRAGETIDGAAAREVLEETGVPISVTLPPVALDGGERLSEATVVLVVGASVRAGSAGQPAPGGDATDARWFTREEVATLDLADLPTKTWLASWASTGLARLGATILDELSEELARVRDELQKASDALVRERAEHGRALAALGPPPIGPDGRVLGGIEACEAFREEFGRLRGALARAVSWAQARLDSPFLTIGKTVEVIEAATLLLLEFRSAAGRPEAFARDRNEVLAAWSRYVESEGGVSPLSATFRTPDELAPVIRRMVARVRKSLPLEGL